MKIIMKLTVGVLSVLAGFVLVGKVVAQGSALDQTQLQSMENVTSDWSQFVSPRKGSQHFENFQRPVWEETSFGRYQHEDCWDQIRGHHGWGGHHPIHPPICPPLVPEPSALALIGIGTGITVLRWRKS